MLIFSSREEYINRGQETSTIGCDNHIIMKKLAEKGWHASNPFLNGLKIPKKFPDGSVFHATHTAYNNWVKKALDDIDRVPDDLLYSKMQSLSNLLKGKIEEAYQSNTKLNDFFKRLDQFEIDQLN